MVNCKVNDGPNFTFLGRDIRVGAPGGCIEIDDCTYARGLSIIHLPRARKQQPEETPSEMEQSQYLSLTQQLVWLSRTTMPDLCYGVSRAQQRLSALSIQDLLDLDNLVRYAQKQAEDKVVITYTRLKEEETRLPVVVGLHNASFARAEHLKSPQGLVVLISTPEVAVRKSPSYLVDWSSTTIKRVVRSTLAAESASAAHALDVVLCEDIAGEHLR
eukprot:653498-Amphidinium_carterae.1